MRRERPNYVVVKTTVDEVTIKDLGPWDLYPTVTNRAESVVAELLESGELKPGQRLMYYDSDGNLDQLLVKDGRFAGFAPGPRELR